MFKRKFFLQNHSQIQTVKMWNRPMIRFSYTAWNILFKTEKATLNIYLLHDLKIENRKCQWMVS